MTKSRLSIILLLWLLLCVTVSPVVSSREKQQKSQRAAPAVIWRNPGDLRSRDLYYGPGTRARMPAPPFDFIEEEKHGVSPKFRVKDARGVTWVVKLGAEARAETVATRLVWAAGYFTEETYYFPRIRVRNLPPLSRGEEYQSPGGIVNGTRFEARRPEVERGKHWNWRKNPFVGTREFDGLRVMMVMLNNHDTKNTNNHIFLVTDPRTGRREARYAVSDLGATLGRIGGFGAKHTKDDLAGFRRARFVLGVEDGMVEFDYHVRPTGWGWVAIGWPPAFLKQWHKQTAMEDIPVVHARWIGTQLARLTNAQLHDVFRAAAYDRATATAFIATLQTRIRQLTALRDTQQHLADVPRQR